MYNLQLAKKHIPSPYQIFIHYIPKKIPNCIQQLNKIAQLDTKLMTNLAKTIKMPTNLTRIYQKEILNGNQQIASPFSI